MGRKPAMNPAGARSSARARPWRAIALPLAVLALLPFGLALRDSPARIVEYVFLLLLVGSMVALILNRVERIRRQALTPVIELARGAATLEIGNPEGVVLPVPSEFYGSEWAELVAAMQSALKRADVRLLEEHRRTTALEASNRALTAELDARESYLDKQTTRLQEAMNSAWQAAEAKTRVLTNTSHEIRTPLNGIIGTTELLLRSQPLNESQRSLLRTQLGAAEALLTLVDDILQLGQATGGLSLQIAPFDVAAEATLVCGALQPLANSRQIGLRVEIPRELHAARVGDRARIRQIMMGLVGNALKFTQHGEVVLELGDTEALDLMLCVRDTGIGIPADQFSRIFEPFFQVDSQVSRRFSGTGLGLAIVNEIVRAMEGRITVESTLGRGSAFYVQLPLEFADPSSLAAAPEPTSAPTVAGDLRVLVVDDIEMNRELLDLQVNSLGARSATAESGQAAIELLESEEFDVLLLDCQMPELDGYQTARAIRSRWPQRSLRIVAVTAHAQPGERERCLRAGMDDYIAKPVAMSVLERVLAGGSDRGDAG